MLKKIALPVVALFALLILASAPAKAAVRFGITVGPPVYTYPVYPYYSNPYAYSYAYPYTPDSYNNYYYAPAPRYVYPYGYWDRNRDYRRLREHELRERWERLERNSREHRR